MGKKRLDYIDLSRGIATFLVMLGHTSVNTYLKMVIYSFHIPLFFIISGLTFNYDRIIDKRKYIINKFKRLMIPYFFWSVIWLAFRGFIGYASNIVNIDSNSFNLRDSILGIILDMRIGEYGGYLWFLEAIFFTYLFATFLFSRRLIRNLITCFLLLVIESFYIHVGGVHFLFASM